MSNFLSNKTLVLGLGLIGGSFAKALIRQNISANIFAYDLDFEALELAKSEGIITQGYSDLRFFSDELEKFDLIILATPLSAYEEIFTELSGKVSPQALIIDLGSIKDLKLKNVPKNFIPCHPIAGSQNSGFEYSKAELFLDAKFFICSERNSSTSQEKLLKIIKRIGANPEFLDAKKHDEIYALVSHLPQFLSFLTAEFSPKNISKEFFKKAFRLDNSSPEIWEDIFKMNSKNLEKFYLEFFDNMEKNIKDEKSWVQNIKGSLPISSEEIDEKFLEENFAAIFFRFLLVKSYLEITKIKNFQNYGGSGFRDFTSIISILSCNQQKLQELILKNRQKIRKFFDLIS